MRQTVCGPPEATAPPPCTGSGWPRWLRSGRSRENAATPCWPRSLPGRNQQPPACKPSWWRRGQRRRTPLRPSAPQPRIAHPRPGKTGPGRPGMQAASATARPARPAPSERWSSRRATPISSAAGWRRAGIQARRPRGERCARPVQQRCSGCCRQRSRIARWPA